jgi:hypothetical protein
MISNLMRLCRKIRKKRGNNSKDRGVANERKLSGKQGHTNGSRMAEAGK